ncbi:MAG TPA: tetratricopeptide repeat protein, partial [Polyangiaceae bacterium]
MALPIASALAQPRGRTGGHLLTGASASASSSAAHAPANQYVPATGPLGPAKDALAKGDYAEAEKFLKTVSGKDRTDALVELARIQTLQGKYADADATAKQLGGANGALVQANILFHTGKRDDAVKLLQANQNATGVPGREVRVMLGDFLIQTGKRADAEVPLMTLPNDYRSDAIKDEDSVGMTLVGRATALLRAWHNADDSYGTAEKDDARNVRAHMWHAELLLPKFNMAGAERHMKAALKLEPKNPDALVAMARIKLQQTMDFDAAEAIVKDALAINPKHVGAHAVRAGLALHDMDIKTAETEIAAGFTSDPNDLELWSLKAAARFLADDKQGYEDARKECLARNKEYSEFYTRVAEYAEWEHRYDDIIAMMKEAVKVDPEDGLAWAQLGLLETRRGDEQDGLLALNKAYSKDKYNIYV